MHESHFLSEFCISHHIFLENCVIKITFFYFLGREMSVYVYENKGVQFHTQPYFRANLIFKLARKSFYMAERVLVLLLVS